MPAAKTIKAVYSSWGIDLTGWQKIKRPAKNHVQLYLSNGRETFLLYANGDLWVYRPRKWWQKLFGKKERR